MTTTMTAAIALLRERVDEPTASFYSDTELANWINEGCRDIARRTGAVQTSATIAIVIGTQSYTAPTDVISIYRVEFEPTGAGNTYTLDYRDMNNMDEVWWTRQRQTQGSYPVFYTLWGTPPTLQIIVYPTPAAAGILRVYYYKTATAVTGGTALDVPNGWDDLAIDYAEYMAMRKRRDPAWSDAKALYEGKMEDMLNRTARWAESNGLIVSSLGTGLPRWLTEDY